MMLYACENDHCPRAYEMVDLERRPSGATCEGCGWEMTAAPSEAYAPTKLEPKAPAGEQRPCPGCGESADVMWRFETSTFDEVGRRIVQGHARLACPNRHFFTIALEEVEDPFLEPTDELERRFRED